VRALAPVLQKAGFGVVALEDARERDLRAAVATIKTRMKTNDYPFRRGRGRIFEPRDALAAADLA